MLECRTYSYAELSALLQTRDRQGIARRLERWEVKYTTTGRGTGQKFTITEIRNPFKVYCLLDFGFAPQTDFTKLAFFTYYLLCDDEFQQLPSAQMEEYLQADGHTLSRQTIKTYLSRFEDADLICRGIRFTYYFAVGKSHKTLTKQHTSVRRRNTGNTFIRAGRRDRQSLRCAAPMAA